MDGDTIKTDAPAGWVEALAESEAQLAAGQTARAKSSDSDAKRRPIYPERTHRFRSGAYARKMGLTVAISGHDTAGVAVCNQVRSFDLEARVRAGSARCIETLDQTTTNEIVSRVLSVIDQGGP